MTGNIIINAYANGVPRQAARIRDELTALGCKMQIARNDAMSAAVTGGNIEISCPPDFCVYLDKDKYVAEMLEKNGVRLFDTARAIAVCDDKMLTHIALSGSGIPMPDTLPGLLCYDENAPLDKEVLLRVEERLGYPFVVKLSYGSMGGGVFLVRDRAEFEKIAKYVQPYPHLFQKYIAAAHGTDMRVIVIGGEVIGGILRKSDGDFRSNIALGGTATAVAVPNDIAVLAARAADIIGLDYCGIDFLLGDTPLLCEVNSNAFFDAFESATGINVAARYAEHIVEKLRM